MTSFYNELFRNVVGQTFTRSRIMKTGTGHLRAFGQLNCIAVCRPTLGAKWMVKTK